MFAFSLVALCILLGAFGQILMKHGMSQIGEINGISQLIAPNTLLKLLTNWAVILGVILYAVALLMWLGALSTLNVSLMYPLLSLGYIVTAILAIVILKENFSMLGWVGVMIIPVGCILIGRA